jgi:hypothetical protein
MGLFAVSSLLVESVQDQLRRIDGLQRDIYQIDMRFVEWQGPTPRQTVSGGKTWQMGISSSP